MARPRKQTYPLETYLNGNKDGDISNNADTQRKPAWKAIINGLIVTILTDDYIPPIILAEEDNSQLDIVDGGSRTAAFMMYRYGNYKITSSVENSLISYKKKVKDENGNIIWEDATFDIKGKRLENIITDDIKDIFNKKDSFIFLTVFDRFTKLGVSDTKFADFLREFKTNYRGNRRNRNGLIFDEIKQSSSTKAKQVITDKLELIDDLMNEFLDNAGEDCSSVNVEKFIVENLDIDVDEFSDDLEDYNDTLDKLLDNTVKIGSKLLDKQNRLSLLAMMIYSYKEDKDLDKWMADYASKNNTYFVDQKRNFLHMKNDFEQYIKKCA